MEGIRNEMVQRNMKHVDWKIRKVWELGCEKRLSILFKKSQRKTTFSIVQKVANAHASARGLILGICRRVGSTISVSSVARSRRCSSSQERAGLIT